MFSLATGRRPKRLVSINDPLTFLFKPIKQFHNENTVYITKYAEIRVHLL